MNRPNIRSLESAIAYQTDPLTLYHHLTHDKKETMLYESADINHQHALNSFMIIDASLRISALDGHLTVEALTINGAHILHYLRKQFTSIIKRDAERSITLKFNRDRLEQSSPLDLLRALQKMANPSHNNAYVTFIGGLFGYDLVGLFRGITIPEKNRENDLVVYLAETLIIIDHVAKKASLQINYLGDLAECKQSATARFDQLITDLNQPLNSSLPPEEMVENRVVEEDDPETFMATVNELKERIIQGEFSQIVPSRRFKIPCQSPIHAYERLKKSHPSPYLFYMNDRDFTLFGASPESALKFDHATRELQLYPIAGTKPRGRNEAGKLDEALDRAMEAELKNDPKEVAEHLMLVDLAEEDLLPISVPNSFTIQEKMKIDRYAYVMHLVSRVTSTLKPELDALDAYIATMNMGTLTGSPKDHAMEAIYQYESEARGSYGGGIGYLNSFGDLDSCIVIRSAFVKEGVATIQAGAGIVNDSVPETELEETRNKANSVIRAIIGDEHKKFSVFSTK